MLGWGSLCWDPRNLPINGGWLKDGPKLKLEFSRISKDARLTLVIDEKNGKELPTLYTFSKRNTLEDAVADLRDREGTICKMIGYIDLKNNLDSKDKYPDQPNIFNIIKKWAKSKSIDGVVWTVLKSNFEKETKKEYTIKNAIQYINSLPETARKNAKEYIDKAPYQIKTSFREKFNS